MIRAAVLAFVLLTVVYIVVSIYSRSVRRERLEKAWDTDPANEGRPVADRASHLAEGMKRYHASLRRRLIVLVYIVPMALVAATIYLVDFQ